MCAPRVLLVVSTSVCCLLLPCGVELLLALKLSRCGAGSGRDAVLILQVLLRPLQDAALMEMQCVKVCKCEPFVSQPWRKTHAHETLSLSLFQHTTLLIILIAQKSTQPTKPTHTLDLAVGGVRIIGSGTGPSFSKYRFFRRLMRTPFLAEVAGASPVCTQC